MFKAPIIGSSDLGDISRKINAYTQRVSQEAYEGGYDDCLCDVIDFIRRVRALPDLADRIKEVFENQLRTNF